MKQLLHSLLVVLLFSCNSDDSDDDTVDCGLVECDSIGVILEFRDLTTGEDLFFNETLSIDDLVITDNETGSVIEFSAFDANFEDAVNILLPFPEEFIAQNISYNIQIDKVFDFDFSYEVFLVDFPCCGDLRFRNFDVDGIDFEEGGTSTSNNGFVIFVEL